MAISQRRMFELWRERKEFLGRIEKLQAKAKQRYDKVMAAMEAHGLKSAVDAETGERITYVAAETVVYVEESVRRDPFFRTKKGQVVLARCTKNVLDTKAIAAEVQAGNIPMEVVSRCTKVKPSAPYLR